MFVRRAREPEAPRPLSVGLSRRPRHLRYRVAAHPRQCLVERSRATDHDRHELGPLAAGLIVIALDPVYYFFARKSETATMIGPARHFEILEKIGEGGMVSSTSARHPP